MSETAASTAVAVRQDTTRLDRELAWLRAHPEAHDQTFYGARGPAAACGTVACLAGWTIMHEPGWEPLWLHSGMLGGAFDPAGVLRYPWPAARAILGLNPAQADALFLQAATLDDLEEVRDLIAAGDQAGIDNWSPRVAVGDDW